MAFDADVLVDRRRLRRKLSFWRVFAFIALAGALIAALAFFGGFNQFERSSSHIARFSISGVIYDSRPQLETLAEIAKNENVKGVIVAINSPGGSTAGGEALYNALRELAEKKPVVAQIGTVGASAGYMVALASDHIVARRNTITGSIGVLFQYGNAAKLMDTIGVSMDAVKSSPLKAEPTFYEAATPAARAMLADLVNDTYDWFVGLVAERRKLDTAKARQLSNGRIFTGHQAQKDGLVDALGGEETAVAWLEKEKKLEKDLPIVDWRPQTQQKGLPLAQAVSGFFSQVVKYVISDGLNQQSGLISQGLALDGLVSVWHASGGIPENNSGGRE
ncbi:MAG: signal peptide peptidase SppA [Stappiaceae bacterium]